MTTTPRPLDGASGAPAIELRSLVKSFPPRRASQDVEVRAVDGIDLRVEPGEVVAFLGPNGAGKTTTLDMVLGLTEPTSGTAEVIDRAGLTLLAGRRVSKCSGGEQQRLRFALALLPDPRLLVLDEPTAGMDVTARRDFWDTMHADASAGRTVVFATHYLEEADAFADRIVLIAGGRIVADGTTAEIRSRASGRTVSATLPSSSLAAAVARLRTVDGVRDVEERGSRVVVTAADSDAVARMLLLDLDGTDLEIVTAGLEQAFMTLTGDERDSRDTGANDHNHEHDHK